MAINYIDIELLPWLPDLFERVKSILCNASDKIELVICSDQYIHEVNKSQLKHDYTTDIITFYYDEVRPSEDAELLISFDTVKSNSLYYKCSLQKEMARVIAHGILHLKGFDDHTKKEQAKMKEEESKVLNQLFHVEQK